MTFVPWALWLIFVVLPYYLIKGLLALLWWAISAPFRLLFGRR